MHLLLVDDNEDDLLLLRDALSRCEMRVQITAVLSGEEALDYLHASVAPTGPTLPDLVLMDINMPRLNGFDVLQAIRTHGRTRHLPVVMLTTSDHPGDIQRAYSDGANSYLCKPLDRKELLRIMASFLEYWSGTARLPGHSATAS